jgi:hypothetical protein
MRAWKLGILAAIGAAWAMGVASCGDPAASAAEYETAKAGGVPGLVAWIRAGKNVSDKTERCTKVYTDISVLREAPLKAALAAPDPDAALAAWRKDNDALLLAMDVCGVAASGTRDALAKMGEVAGDTAHETAIKKEMDADLNALDAAGDDRFKAWGLIAAGRADKRRIHLEDARGPLPALMLDKYFEKFPGPKVALGSTADEVKKAWGPPATTKPVEGAVDTTGAAVPTEEWTYPDKGIILAVIQGGTLQRLIVGEGWADPIMGVQIGDDIANPTSNLFGALAREGEKLGTEKVRLTADPDVYIEWAAWIDKDGVVQRISLAKNTFFPYGPKPDATKGAPGTGTGAAATAAPAPATAAGKAPASTAKGK